MAGAEIYSGARIVARSDASGRASMDVRGTEGESFELRVKCPAGFRSPAEPTVIRRFDVKAVGAPEYAVTCQPTRHELVVAVRADGGGNLPVLYLGKEVARTDRSGAAHVMIDADCHDRVELTLATLGKDKERMHPQNPIAIFDMPDHDDIQLFAETFTRDAKKAPARGPRRTIRQF